jgi:hypothetical protein
MLLDATARDASGCVAYVGSSTGNKTIADKTLAAGSFWIMIDTWPTPNCIPTFALSITEDVPPPPPPANDVCAGAIDLQSFDTNVFTVDLCAGYTNNYDAGGTAGCTGYTSAGKDATYKIYLDAGENITASMVSAHDSALWLVTDCAAAAATCVAGADGFPRRHRDHQLQRRRRRLVLPDHRRVRRRRLQRGHRHHRRACRQ